MLGVPELSEFTKAPHAVSMFDWLVPARLPSVTCVSPTGPTYILPRPRDPLCVLLRLTTAQTCGNSPPEPPPSMGGERGTTNPAVVPSRGVTRMLWAMIPV